MLSNMVNSTWKKKENDAIAFKLFMMYSYYQFVRLLFFYQNNVVLNLLNSQISYQFMFNLSVISVFPGRFLTRNQVC